MIREAPKILACFQLPKSLPDDPEEALVFAVHPETGDLVVQVACTPERLATHTYDRPLSFPLPRDAALILAHEVLRHWAPEIAEVVERYCIAAQLRVIEGGGNAPEAS